MFIHTTALLIDLQFLHMSALCYVTPYLCHGLQASPVKGWLSSVVLWAYGGIQRQTH